MIWIDIDMPKNCMCCPFQSVGTDFYYCHCPGVDERAYDFDQAESIPDDCPLHEVAADPDTVSRPQIHCKDCKHCYPPLTAVVDNEVKEVSDFRCSRMFGFTEADGWCYMFERKSSDG